MKFRSGGISTRMEIVKVKIKGRERYRGDKEVEVKIKDGIEETKREYKKGEVIYRQNIRVR